MSSYDSTSSTVTSIVLVPLVSIHKDIRKSYKYYQFFLVSSFLKAVVRPEHLIVNVNSLLQLVQLHVEIGMTLLLLPQPDGMLDVVLIIRVPIVVLVLTFSEHTDLLETYLAPFDLLWLRLFLNSSRLLK